MPEVHAFIEGKKSSMNQAQHLRLYLCLLILPFVPLLGLTSVDAKVDNGVKKTYYNNGAMEQKPLYDEQGDTVYVEHY